MTDGGAFFGCRGGRAQLNQDDDSGSDGNRSERVQDDAEGAMVGVGLEGVGMGYLDDREEGQQDETQDRRRHEHMGPSEEGLTSSWLKPTHFALRATRIP